MSHRSEKKERKKLTCCHLPRLRAETLFIEVFGRGERGGVSGVWIMFPLGLRFRYFRDRVGR
jgi:hypothetical protein